jgi:glycosyltransferase involved in cell wall biosynthesis
MPDRIRVGYVINRWFVGGAETVAMDLARSLDPQRFEPTLISVIEPRDEQEPEMLRRCRAAGVRSLTLYQNSFRDPRACLRLWALLARERFDIVHGHSRFADAWAVEIGSWAARSRFLWTRHLVYRDLSEFQLKRYRRLSATAYRVIAVSDAVRRAAIETEGIAPEKVVTIVNGIDLDKYAPLSPDARRAMRRELDVGDCERLLLYVGRIDEQKAPEAFVDLIWTLRAQGQAVRGFMCGRGPLEEAVRAKLAGGPGGVEMLGLRSDVPQLLGCADLFVSTSRNEGLPLNFMEAMAAGTPFIGPALDMIHELLAGAPELADCLYAAPPFAGPVQAEMIRGWAAQLTTLLTDPNRLAMIGARGRAIIGEKYSLELMVRRHEALYLDALDRRA